MHGRLDRLALVALGDWRPWPCCMGRRGVTTAATRASSESAVSSADGEPLFALRDVRYLYGGRQVALDGIDLRIERGERVALLGANGSASPRCSSCSTGSSRHRVARCAPSVATSRRWPTGRTRSASIARLASSSGPRTSNCSAPPCWTTSPSARSSSACGKTRCGRCDEALRADGDRAPRRSRAVRALGR